jgi:hypothetical protein
MTCYLDQCTRLVLWADLSLLRGMGSGFRGKKATLDTKDLLIWVGIVAGVAIVVWFLSQLLSRQERVRRFNSPRALFRILCRAHELDRASKSLLKRLARYHQLSHPARLFLEPQRFELDGLGPEWVSQREPLAVLRERLFAAPIGEESAEQPADQPSGQISKPSRAPVSQGGAS